MSHNTANTPEETSKLHAWLTAWPAVRVEIEQQIAAHAERDPSLHFELTLANIELQDISEAVKRTGALWKLLYGEDLTSAELKATGNY